VAGGGAPLHGPLDRPSTLVVGAEREGLPPDVIAACDRTAHLPIATDSLNAAVAASIALYEATRGVAVTAADAPPAVAPTIARVAPS